MPNAHLGNAAGVLTANEKRVEKSPMERVASALHDMCQPLMTLQEPPARTHARYTKLFLRTLLERYKVMLRTREFTIWAPKGESGPPER